MIDPLIVTDKDIQTFTEKFGLKRINNNLNVYFLKKGLLQYFLNTTQSEITRILNFKDNSYVVVTGATDGIGFGFCQAFAKIGFNIILISRNAKKLDTCSKILAGKYAISTICIEANFLNSLEEDFFKDIYEKIKHLDIAILVNNVGTALGSDFLSNDD